MSGNSVEVGFTDHLENPLLFSPCHFPSKVGGHPSWLNPANLPDVTLCPNCQQPLIFLAQVYAGLDRPSNGFHRMLYVFCCRKADCYKEEKQPVIVLRSQLAADNPFYGVEPVPEGDADSNTIGENKSFALAHNGYTYLCKICGGKGPLACSKCKQAHYCGKEHQKHDWTEHKRCCSEKSLTSVSSNREHLSKSSMLYKEFDIIIDREKEKEDLKISEEELERMKSTSDSYNISLKDAESLSREYGTDHDPTFSKFKERISRDPDQILRYARHDPEPLWPVASSKCTAVPPCNNCGGPRTFEFQLLPTLLYAIGESDLDWATIVVYTCSTDCEVREYVEEFAWTQTYSA